MMRKRSEPNATALIASVRRFAHAFGEKHAVDLRMPSESEAKNMLEEIFFGKKDVLKALSMRIITLEEARNRTLFELELWLRARQPVPQRQVSEWVPPEVSDAIDGWLAEWLEQRSKP